MAISQLFASNNYSIFAENLDVSGSVSVGVDTVNNSVSSVLGVVNGGDVVLKSSSETTTIPTWTWLSGSNPQPAFLRIKAIRSGGYCQCQLYVTGLTVLASGSPYIATFTLPFPVSPAFLGGTGELTASSSVSPFGTGITSLAFASVGESTTLGQVGIACSADSSVNLTATIYYNSLA